MNRQKIGILGLQYSNYSSCYNACRRLGYNTCVITSKDEIKKSSLVLIPGVGNFHEVSSYLHNSGIAQTLIEYHASGNPLLGICLGMQLLFQDSEESQKKNKGLGLLCGNVVKNPRNQFDGANVGWHEVNISDLNFALEEKRLKFYFVHQYVCRVAKGYSIISGFTSGGVCAFVRKSNLIGFQFHPERSGLNGLKLLYGALNSLLNA